MAAWGLLALGHVAVAGGGFAHEWESRFRVAALLAGAGAVVLGSRVFTSRAARVGSSALTIAALIAAGAALGLEASRRASPLEVHPRPIEVEIRGFVSDASRADQTPPTLRVDVARVTVGHRARALRATVLLRWPSGSPPPAWMVAGTPIAARGTVRGLEDARNPGGVPPGRWLESDGIDATFDVAPGEVEAWNPPAGEAGRDRRGGARLAAELRRSLGRLFDAHAPASASALARGMLLGDRVGIDAETRDSFRNAGTLHILSISGLHVCIVAAFVAVAVRALGLGGVASAGLEFAALAAYVAFVGAPPPALRSALLWVLARGGRLLGRGGSPFAAWGAAGLALHLVDPAMPQDLGFLLSFAAVLGLEAGAALAPAVRPDENAPRWKTWMRHVITGVASGVGASIGTLPIEVAAFGSIPIAGPVANLLVIPLTTLFLAEAILLVCVAPWTPPWIGDLLGGALGASGDLLRYANDHLGGHVTPLAVHGVPGRGALAAAYAAMIGVAAIRMGGRPRPHARPRVARAAAVLLVALAAGLPIVAALDPFALAPSRPPRIVALDVGQGDATIVADGRGQALLVDAGPRSARRDEGRLTVEPALRAEGVHGRVTAVGSHGHRDHEGGFLGLAERGWISRVIENGGGSADRDDWRRAVRAHGGRDEVLRPRGAATTVRAGAWRLDAEGPRAGRDPTRPPAPDTSVAGSANAAENNRSIVATVRLDSANAPAVALFPGDIESDGEASWLATGLGRVLVLKVPHHGSRTSSTASWVARVHPRVAIVSAGERNRHRHPSPETLRRYRRAGAWVVRTDHEGAVRVTRASRGFVISTRGHPSPRPLNPSPAESLSPYIDFP